MDTQEKILIGICCISAIAFIFASVAQFNQLNKHDYICEHNPSKSLFGVDSKYEADYYDNTYPAVDCIENPNKVKISKYGEEYKIVDGRYVYKICSLDDIPTVAYYFKDFGHGSYQSTRRYNNETCLKAGGTWDWEKNQAIPVIEINGK